MYQAQTSAQVHTAVHTDAQTGLLAANVRSKVGLSDHSKQGSAMTVVERCSTLQQKYQTLQQSGGKYLS